MSKVHEEAFDRIKQEYRDVISGLEVAAKIRKRGQRGNPRFDPLGIEPAINTAGDAYALLLIATAEAFMREHLVSAGKRLPDEPKLSTLIDMCRKEHNRDHPASKIPREYAQELHNLRVQRNQYAHGQGTAVFPSVARVAATLGRFFHNIE
jgi:hypothetical protein